LVACVAADKQRFGWWRFSLGEMLRTGGKGGIGNCRDRVE
jgi:hypothetical protein